MTGRFEKGAVMARDGLRIAEISADEFRHFAKRHASSPEIGPIQTSLDGGVDAPDDCDRVLAGLWGCDTLCAVACFHIYRSARGQARRVLKLDSVVVDGRLRRRGLAGLLVTQAFADLVADTARNIARIYAHSVHPGTVRLLRRLGFNDPQVTGAPISDIDVGAEAREAFLKACELQVVDHMRQIKLQCEFCRKRDKRARPWCLPRGGKR
jgi:GNAT superfamily N-acetyltransferase